MKNQGIPYCFFIIYSFPLFHSIIHLKTNAMKKQLQSISAKTIFIVLIIFVMGNKLFAQDQLVYDYGIKVIFEAKTYKNGFNISCNGNSDGNIIVTVVGGTYPFSYSWSRGDTTQNLNNAAAGTYTLTVTDADGHQDIEQVGLKQPDAFAVFLFPSLYKDGNNISQIGASNRAIKAEVKGGSPPYKYLWSNSSTRQEQERLQAGTYSVTVTDQNHCTVTATQVMTEPSVLHIVSMTASNYNGSNISCAGGSDGAVTLSVAGGSPPYSFNWSNGSLDQSPTNLSAGDYRVVVTDDNGTQAQGTITLAEPQQLGATLTVSDYYGYNISCANCADGSINTSVTGGTAPYTYIWVNQQTIENLKSMGLDKHGASINLSTIGTLGPTTANVNSLRQGDYAVIITDANRCRTINGAGLKETPKDLDMQVFIEPKRKKEKTNISCYGGADGEIDVTVIGGMAPYTYAWSNGSNADTLKNIGAGTYSLTVTDNKNRTWSSKLITLYQPDQFGVYLKKSKFFDGYYNISKSGGNDGAVRAWVKGGNPPYNFMWSNDSTSQTIEDLTAGTYNLTVTDNSGCAVTASATLVEPTALSIVSIISPLHNGYNVSCAKGEDGVINLTIAGGVPPFKYIWSNGSFRQNPVKLRADDYEVRVIDANGWEVVGQITLTEPHPLDLQLTTSNYNGNNISCFGCANGTITTNVIGGTAPYTYSWKSDPPTINGQTTANLSSLDVGNYYVSVTDANGCATENKTGLSQPANIGWDFGGNTVDSTQFIGSTNNAPFIIKTNNTEQMRIMPSGDVTINNNATINGTLTTSNLSITNSFTSNKIYTGRITSLPGDSILSFGDSSIHMVTNTNRIFATPYGSIRGLSIGTGSIAYGAGSTAIGYSATTGTSGTFAGNKAIAIGTNINNPIDNSLMIGFNSNLPTLFVSPANGTGTTGNVGIGTGAETPGDKLQVGTGIGKVVMGSAIGSDLGWGTSYIGFNATRNNSSAWSTGTQWGQFVSGSVIYGDAGGGINFATINDQSIPNPTDAQIYSNRMTMMRIQRTANGDIRVGIGTDFSMPNYNTWTPYTLAVNGGIRCQYLKVEPDWSDFVFDKNYKLPTLQEVELYINANGHLPEIPSNKEVCDNGIDVGEINAKLLQKVEELTLYIIDLQKQVNELKKK